MFMHSCSVMQLCLTLCDPMDCNHQAPLSIGFSRQKYWRGLPFPLPRDLPDPGIEPESPALQADTLLSEPPVKPMVNKYEIIIMEVGLEDRYKMVLTGSFKGCSSFPFLKTAEE